MNVIILAIWLYFANHLTCGLAAPHNEGKLASRNSFNERAETEAEYLVTPTDAQNPDLMHNLAQYLREITGKSDIYNYTDSDGQFYWWIVDLIDRERDKVEEHRDVEFVGSTEAAGPPEGITPASSKRHHQQFGNWTEGALPPDVHKRRINEDEIYEFQVKAPEDLQDLSRKGIYGTEKNDEPIYYVYPEDAGDGTFLYHFEDGILPGYDEEFPSDRVETPLKTKTYEKLEQTNRHRKPTSHSTCAASKALGTKYGAAKKATLVSVLQGDMTLASMVEGFNLAAEDIAKKKRQRKSVVLLVSVSLSTVEEMMAEACNNPLIRAIQRSLKKLLSMGVPVVVSAGNSAQQLHPLTNQLRTNVDTVPAALDLPTFVIGSADKHGQAAASSQRGPRITGWARGTDVRCAGESQLMSGTSFSTPALAGALLTFMGRNFGVLFDDYTMHAEGIEFIRKVEEFIKLRAIWVRGNGVKMFWNLAEEDDFP